MKTTIERAADKPSLFSKAGRIVLTSLAILVLYILSVGPSRRLHHRSSPTVQRAIEAIYSPLRVLPEKSVPGRWLSAYAELWD